MANTLVTSDMIAKEALLLLENNLVFARGVNRKYEKDFNGEYKVGDTVNVKTPSQYTVRSGAAASVQDNVQGSVPVVVDQQKGIDVEFTSKELALDLQDFSKEVLAPQIITLANHVDFSGLELYKSVPNAVGTPGTIPSSMKTYAQAGARMNNEGAPIDEERHIVMDALSEVELIDAQKGLFQSSSQIKEQYEKGRMGMAAGFNFAMSQNVNNHTVGAWVGTPLVNATLASGATSVVTDGWTGTVSGLLKKGDVVTFAGCYAVNPLTKQSTGYLRQFVITADVNSSSGAATLPIFPAMISTGATQNVSALPADNAAITVLGAAGTLSPTNLAYHKDAFTLVTVDLPLPKGMDMASRAASKKAGLSIRFIRGYDINSDKFISRLDVLYGWKAIRPELACRIQA